MRKAWFVWTLGLVLAWSAAVAAQTDEDLAQENEDVTAADVAVEVVMPRVLVRGFDFVGNEAVSDEELTALLAPMIGQELTVADLRAAEFAVTVFYRESGYFAAQAILPAQEVRDGIVTIEIFEGRYDQVILHNESRLRDSVAHAILASLESDAPIFAAPYERVTWLMHDLAGVEPQITLVPGTRLGTASVEVSLRDGVRTSGQLTASYSGDGSSPGWSPAAAVDLYNVTGRGDTAKLTYSGDLSDRVIGALYSLPLPWGSGATLTVQGSDARSAATVAGLEAVATQQNLSATLGYWLTRSGAERRMVSVSVSHGFNASSVDDVGTSRRRTPA